MKYIIVTGGVVSGLGKGVTISSTGRLLQACGFRVTAIKIDPYLNVDAGTMSPFEHGEVRYHEWREREKELMVSMDTAMNQCVGVARHSAFSHHATLLSMRALGLARDTLVSRGFE